MTDLLVDPQTLARLHRILRQQEDLNSRIRKCPVRANLARKAEQDLVLALEKNRELLKKTRMAADQKQLQLNERESRIQSVIGKRNACESNREYQLLSDQIAADQQANSVQSDEVLELLERIDAIETEIARIGNDLKLAQSETRRVQSVVDGEMQVLHDDLQAVRAERSEAEKMLGGEIRERYRRLADSVAEEALAVVEDGCCGRCCTTQTTQVISDLMLQKVVFCKSCGSLLYLPQQAD
jgi:predicted  nucleic acid-binding Zn-ribbon protein